jgi:hypothetical protein
MGNATSSSAFVNCLEDSGLRDQIPRDTATILHDVSSNITTIFTQHFDSSGSGSAWGPPTIAHFEPKLSDNGLEFTDRSRCCKIKPTASINGLGSGLAALSTLTHARCVLTIQVRELTPNSVFSVGICLRAGRDAKSLNDGFGNATNSW